MIAHKQYSIKKKPMVVDGYPKYPNSLHIRIETDTDSNYQYSTSLNLRPISSTI